MVAHDNKQYQELVRRGELHGLTREEFKKIRDKMGLISAFRDKTGLAWDRRPDGLYYPNWDR